MPNPQPSNHVYPFRVPTKLYHQMRVTLAKKSIPRDYLANRLRDTFLRVLQELQAGKAAQVLHAPKPAPMPNAKRSAAERHKRIAPIIKEDSNRLPLINSIITEERPTNKFMLAEE